MSTNQQRLKSAIRAIALTPGERRALLGESSNKGGKAASAGVGTSEAEESRLCCDGSTSDSANPGAEERDPDSSSQEGLNSDDPAKLESGDGALSGVTDCATGEPICFDGSGFIPPDDWDEPNDPPVEPTWQLGKYGKLTIDSNVEYLASYQLARNEVEIICEENCPDSTDCSSVDFISCGVIANAQEVYCSNRYDSRYCDEDNPPLAESWPTDGCTNLAIVNGAIVGSKYDPDQDGSYSAPRDSIDLCDGEGNQISLAPAANGGWKTINSTTNNGYLYDSSGKQIAHIDGNEYSDPNV